MLKATIAKQLETRVEWDDLVWKATAAYNFFPTESSGVAPFLLMPGFSTNYARFIRPVARVGSGDPVRVLRLYTTNTLDEV